MSIISWILDHKWAITPSALETIISIAQREDLSPEAIAKNIHGTEWEKYIKDGKAIDFSLLEASNYPILEGTRRVSISDRVAILPIIGPIFPRANLMTMSGGVSLQSLSYDFNVALQNKMVDTIILNIDSPGGEVTGISEFSEMIFKAQEKKTIISYVLGMGASAGYWIASSSSEIIISNTGEVGSIGVVAAYTSDKESREKKGLKDFEIVSSQSPNKRPDLETSQGRAQIQELVDNLAGVFIASVARNRGIESEDVLKNYGQGKMFVGESALEAGMVDRIGNLEMIIQEQKSKKSNLSTHNFFIGGLMNEQELMVQHPALYKSILEKGKEEGKKEAEETIASKIVEAKKEGATSENARIKAIESIEAPGAQKVISENKFDMTQTADSISTLILKSQKEEREKMKTNRSQDGLELAGQSGSLPSGGTEGMDEKTVVAAIVKGMNSR